MSIKIKMHQIFQIQTKIMSIKIKMPQIFQIQTKIMCSKIKIKMTQIFQIKNIMMSGKIKFVVKEILQAWTKISSSQFNFPMVKIKYKISRSSKFPKMLKNWQIKIWMKIVKKIQIIWDFNSSQMRFQILKKFLIKNQCKWTQSIIQIFIIKYSRQLVFQTINTTLIKTKIK